MDVTLTPNVAAVVRADPILAIVVETFRRETKIGGYLNLFRSNRTGPFDVIYYLDGQRSSCRDTDLLAAIEYAITSNPARAAA